MNADKYNEDKAKFLEMGGKVDSERPMLDEDTPKYFIDSHYAMMGIESFRQIIRQSPEKHIDIGGDIDFLMYLSEFVPVEHIDIRCPTMTLPRMTYVKGDALNLPLEDDSVESLSCLSVAEHIGLGRFGDKIDPDGFKKCCAELVRVLSNGGLLYFAVPVGIPQTVFNAHRILSYRQVLDALEGLELVKFSALDSDGNFNPSADEKFIESDRYGCGLFVMVKP